MIQALKYRKPRLLFYFKGLLTTLLPVCIFPWRRERILLRLKYKDRDYICDRVNYYIRGTQAFSVTSDAVFMNDISPKKQSVYYIDMLNVLKYFPNARFDYLFGDVTHIPATPTFVKSRPISPDNQNSVLLKLNSMRHYNFIRDEISYEDKADMLVWRGRTNSFHHRAEVCRQYFHHPFCDIAVSGPFFDTKSIEFAKAPLSIAQQLSYKFILSMEGTDVATNLKWIMSSNSLCFMRKPRYETWFMEGKLIPDYHYVELKDDFSDLVEKVEFYQAHPDKAKKIIQNAHEHVKQFLNEKRERAISILVVQKYLELSGYK